MLIYDNIYYLYVSLFIIQVSHILPAEELSASPGALCSMQSVSYCGLSQLLCYIIRTDGRSTKAVCVFHKLIKQY